MDNSDIQTIIHSSEFKSLLAARKRLATPVIFIIITSYFGFILLVAFAPTSLSTTIGTGTISIGIYSGLFLLLLSYVLTAIYLRVSNGEIAKLQKDIQNKF